MPTPLSLRWSLAARLLPAALALACTGTDVDFFEPTATGGGPPQGGAPAEGGSGGAQGGSGDPVGGASGTAGTDSPMGGTSGTAGTDSPMGGTSGAPGGAGGTDSVGGSDSGGGTGATGGDEAMGGSSAGGMGGDGGSAGATGGTGGEPMGGAGAGGASGTGTGGDAGAGAGGASGAGGGCVPSDERCDGIDNDCENGVDEGSTCPSGCSGRTREGRVYLLCSFGSSGPGGGQSRSFAQANTFCANQDMVLVQVDDADENAFIVEWLEEEDLDDPVWMGANDQDRPGTLTREGQWVWGTGNEAVQFWRGGANGMPVMDRYNDWDNGQPNDGGAFSVLGEDCAVFDPDDDWHWDDVSCSASRPNLVCEDAAAD